MSSSGMVENFVIKKTVGKKAAWGAAA